MNTSGERPLDPRSSLDLTRGLTRRQTLGRLVGGGAGLLLAGSGLRGAGTGAQDGAGATPVAGTPAVATPLAGTPAVATPLAGRTTFVLVHGAFFGGAGWEPVATQLRGAGHKVVVPNLPAHGADQTPIADVSLQSYVDRVLEILDAEPAPVVLVGHSMGGIVISQTAEQRPDTIGTLVYLAAYLPQNGQSLFDLALADADSQLGPALMIDEATGVGTLPVEVFAETFLHDVPAAAAATARAGLRPEPLAPLATPVATTDANFGRVRRIYIETLQDRVVSPALQQQMYTALPCERVISMDTGHCPFLAKPDELAGHLLAV